MYQRYSNKLIVLRGNSGSGKSAVARELREQAKKINKIALVEQDYLRRIVLKEKEKEGGDNIKLIKRVVKFALAHNYDVILEGILYSGRYSAVIKQLIKETPNHFVYYFDVSLKETLLRHKTKPNCHQFGENEIKNWYTEKDLLRVADEKVIDETSTLQDTVMRILMETGI